MEPTKKIQIDNNFIRIYDDVFEGFEKHWMSGFAGSSKYDISRVSGDEQLEHRQYSKTLVSRYSITDVLTLGFFKNKNIQNIIKSNNLKYDRSYVNLVTSSDVFSWHIDSNNSEDLTGLYYVNTEWHNDWEGETHFSDKHMKEVIHASSFLPGRFILFDSTIPHKSTQPSFNSKFYRLTYAIKFSKDPDYAIDILDFIIPDDKDIFPTEKESKVIQFAKQNYSHINHSNSNLFEHFYQTYKLLKKYNCDEDTCIAGLLHSIYETDYFKNVPEVDKNYIIDLIGEKSNYMISIFCSDNRDFNILNNTNNLDKATYKNMLYILYANLVEQSHRIEFEQSIFATIKNRINSLNNLN